MLVVLLEDGGRELSLGSGAARQLAALGVTRVVVLRNDETLGFVLEGWAFNPGRSARQALDALAADTPSATTLRLVMETALHCDPARS
jgi:NAD(P)-dependent dehydrogenase (short-subunit alcohol dehydrogenase family)